MPSLPIFLLSIPAVLLAQSPQSTNQIILWDKHFKAQTVVTEKEYLSEITTIWKSKKPVKPTVQPTFDYKIDFYQSKSASRWVYDPGGYATLYGKNQSQVFVIASAQRLNQLLGIKP
jgi:hypothetical protein